MGSHYGPWSETIQMNTTLDAPTIGLFMLVVFPGLVSTTIYRLIMPARALEWGNAEPPRDCRRLLLLREWSHDQADQTIPVFSRGA
jgi:hypothetical protein